MAVRDQVLVDETAHRQTAGARPARRQVDQRDHLRAVQHDPALLRALRVEPQLRSDDPAQRQLLLPRHREPGLVQVHRVPEPPVVQPHPAPALEYLRAGAARRGRGVDHAVRGSGALVPRVDAHPRLGHVERPLHRQLRGVQRPAVLCRPQPAAAQGQRTAHLRPAQAQLAQRLDHLGLEVLRDRHAVPDDGPPVPVRADAELVDQQVRADLGVGQPDAPVDPAARQMQIALRLQPRRLQPGQRAAHQPQRREVTLREHHLLLESAAGQLHVRRDPAARQIQLSGDPHAPELQRRHPAGPGGRTAQQQPRHRARADAPLRPPGVRGERVVARRVVGP